MRRSASVWLLAVAVATLGACHAAPARAATIDESDPVQPVDEPPSQESLYARAEQRQGLNDHAGALVSYARYLQNGGNLDPERRRPIEADMARLTPRVAKLQVMVNLDGAVLYVDDVPVCASVIERPCVGRSPLPSPIIVNGGRHKVTATKKGYAPATVLISVVGSDELEVKLDVVTYD